MKEFKSKNESPLTYLEMPFNPSSQQVQAALNHAGDIEKVLELLETKTEDTKKRTCLPLDVAGCLTKAEKKETFYFRLGGATALFLLAPLPLVTEELLTSWILRECDLALAPPSTSPPFVFQEEDSIEFVENSHLPSPFYPHQDEAAAQLLEKIQVVIDQEKLTDMDFRILIPPRTSLKNQTIKRIKETFLGEDTFQKYQPAELDELILDRVLMTSAFKNNKDGEQTSKGWQQWHRFATEIRQNTKRLILNYP